MTRLQTRTAWLIAAVLLFSSTGAWAMDLGGHDRDGTVIGLTLGYGWNTIKFTTPEGVEVDSGNVETFTGGFRVGWASSDYFIASLGMYGWKKSYYTYSYLNTSVTSYNFMLEGYFFPMGEGFWVKGGVGRGTLDLYAQAIIPSDSITFNEKDWAWSTGAGYEFRLSDEAAFGISYDLIYLDVGDAGNVTSVSNLSQSVSINIHFYM